MFASEPSWQIAIVGLAAAAFVALGFFLARLFEWLSGSDPETYTED